jgi:two-component system, cell cycle sensor histidine kinase and response regulator CckA
MHKLHSFAPRRPNPIRVLVVDDEPPVREFVSRVLCDAGYEVTTAGDGPGAIALVAQLGAPDLLLTDFRMPQMNGDELAARLRQSLPDLKVLYLTGYSQALFDNRALLWEGEAFLEKPSSPSELLEGVSMILFNRTAPTTAGLPRQMAAMRSLLGSLAKNRGRDVV